MRLLFYFLVLVLVLLQFPLWLGKGGWLKVWEMRSQVEQLEITQQEKILRNESLHSLVKDLKTGQEAIEEEARYELGLVKKNEVFIQILPTEKMPAPSRSISGTIQPIQISPKKH